MRTDIVCAVLDCDEKALSLLDKAKANVVDTIFKMDEMGWSTKMTDIIMKICEDGLTTMEKNIERIKKFLEGAEHYAVLSEHGKKQLASLRIYNLRPLNDFQRVVDHQNGTAYLSCSDEIKDVYEKFFGKELENLMDYTGLAIKWARI